MDRIKISLPQKYVLIFRIVMVLLAMYYLEAIYDALVSGIAYAGSFTHTEQDSFFGYYAVLFKYSSFVWVFIWLGTGGVKAKIN